MARKKKKEEVEKDIIPKKSIINRTNILFIDIQVFLTCLVIILFIIRVAILVLLILRLLGVF